MFHPAKTPHPVRLFDLSIPDIQERQQRVLYFDTLKEAAEYVGCSTLTLRKNIGSRVLSKRWGKRFAVRAVSTEIQKRA